LIVVIFAVCAIYAGTIPAAAKTLIVCPAGAQHANCAFTGNLGIQAAIDKAADGDTVLLKAGIYVPEKFRDVPYQEYVIRGFLVIEHKRIELAGEPGAILDGSGGPAVSAIVVNGGDVALNNLVIRNFRAGDKEDDLYEGHGVFIIDAAAAVSNLTIERYQKMGLTGRGSSLVTASNVRIQDGHVAIWLEESAHLRLCNSIVRNNESAGVAAYVNSSASIYSSVFDGNQDDGLYAAGEAVIFATNSLILRNQPFAVRVIDNARAWVGHSVLFGNAASIGSPAGSQQVKLGSGIIEKDPKADAAYRLPAALDGDPDVRDPAGAKSRIGLYEVAGCLPALFRQE
jgi:hypothetical protein